MHPLAITTTLRAEQCVCIIISHRDCYAGTILPGFCDTRSGHPPTHPSFGSQSAIALLQSIHAPWCSGHAQKLTQLQRHHTGLYLCVSHLPGMPSSPRLSSQILLINSNFISIRLHSSLLPPEEVTPPSFVPKGTITNIASYSCCCEL